MVPLQQVEYGVHGDLILIYPEPYSINVRGTIDVYKGYMLAYIGVYGD